MIYLIDDVILQVVWFFEDEPITPGSDLEIETTDTYTSLRIQVIYFSNRK